MSEERNEDEAAQAFDALWKLVEEQGKGLNDELTLIRQGVEGAFDQLETLQKPTDYGTDLGVIKNSLASYGEVLEELVKSPALKHGAEERAQVMGHAGETLVREAVNQLGNSSRFPQNSGTGSVQPNRKSSGQSETKSFCKTSRIGWLFMCSNSGLSFTAAATFSDRHLFGFSDHWKRSLECWC